MAEPSAPAGVCIQVAVPVPLPRLFDYLPVENETIPAPGSRVLVPFGRRRLIGLVLGHGSAQSGVELKRIEQVVDHDLIDPNLLELAHWCRHYYCFPPGELINLLLPVALRRVKPFRQPPPDGLALTEAGSRADLARAPKQADIRSRLEQGPKARDELLEAGASAALLRRMQSDGLVQPVAAPMERALVPGPDLNAEQRMAVAAILRARRQYSAFLLAGVTGSGKTEVYLRAARRLLAGHRQILVLVPEIGLTPQLVRRIEARLGHRAMTYHSGMSDGERLVCWQAARDGSARVIVGTRSAVFLPLKHPGLIVVDEEHDGSFKQQEGARYQGRDVAVLRARMQQVPIVLGSATPALESLHNVAQGRYRQLRLSERAGSAVEPSWKVMDQRGSQGELDTALVAVIQRHLDDQGQVLLYRNRRGYAPVLMCNSCGWQADCERCSAHLTWHRVGARLQCHHCGATRAQPPRCPDCGAPDLVPLGAGTERLESLLAAQFPATPVYRVDRDSMTGKNDFEALLEKVRSGQPCILVGTQMLAKGHHLPNVTLAAVMDVDQALFSADFRAPERLGQAVSQVAGRSGRGHKAGEFILQTRHPEHPLLAELRQGDYLGFAGKLLAERRAADLPPATALALVRAEAHQTEPARAFLKRAAGLLRGRGLTIAGPIPAIMSRRAGYWRFQLWVQSRERSVLANQLSGHLESLHKLPEARKVRWHIDMDPAEF